MVGGHPWERLNQVLPDPGRSPSPRLDSFNNRLQQGSFAPLHLPARLPEVPSRGKVISLWPPDPELELS